MNDAKTRMTKLCKRKYNHYTHNHVFTVHYKFTRIHFIMMYHFIVILFCSLYILFLKFEITVCRNAAEASYEKE